ncbi:hypothetical protein [Mycolicibacterium sphagni]|uniref:hypothetical protein n=1 Tax=Mycolicibacterium sphagni TaxID=1786 RepID=UPI001F1644DB|nr:hypothetical protein [Mycolicibacterium sphagni]
MGGTTICAALAEGEVVAALVTAAAAAARGVVAPPPPDRFAAYAPSNAVSKLAIADSADLSGLRGAGDADAVGVTAVAATVACAAGEVTDV